MKENTQNEYEKAVNRVIDYINQHLYSSPNIKELSDIANMSEFHFHRVFKAVVGENVGEYINRIRLEHIAQRLHISKSGLQEIAERTGYGTKHALSKAFKKHFGVSPSVYRRAPKNMEPFFKEREQRRSIVPQIKETGEKRLVYIRIVDWYGAPESYTRAWNELGKFAKRNNLIETGTEFIGLSFDDPTITPPEKCRFYACFTTSKDVKPTGPFGIQYTQPGLYAVFLHEGSYYELIDTYFYIYTNWLPNNTDYRSTGSMSFEKYLNSPDNTEEKDLMTEIYIPVKHI